LPGDPNSQLSTHWSWTVRNPAAITSFKMRDDSPAPSYHSVPRPPLVNKMVPFGDLLCSATFNRARAGAATFWTGDPNLVAAAVRTLCWPRNHLDTAQRPRRLWKCCPRREDRHDDQAAQDCRRTDNASCFRDHAGEYAPQALRGFRGFALMSTSGFQDLAIRAEKARG
jgi:hypothetical protein